MLAIIKPKMMTIDSRYGKTMHGIAIIFFAFLLTSSLNAQNISSEEFDAELEKQWEKDFKETSFTENDFALQDKIFHLQNRMNERPTEFEEVEITAEDPWTPDKLRAAFKPGDTIYSLDGRTAFKIDKFFYAWTRLKESTSQLTYIFNHKDEVVYVALTREVNFVEPDLKIARGPYENVSYKGPSEFNKKDKFVRIHHDLSYQLEAHDGAYYESIINSEAKGQARSNSFNFRSAYKTNVDLDFGLELSYQNGSYEVADEENLLRWQALSIGPLVRYQLNQNEDVPLLLNLSVLKSLYMKGEAANERLSFNSYKLKFSFEIKNTFDHFDAFAGLGLLTEWLSFREGAENFNNQSNKEVNQAYFLYVGLGFDTIL
jgi:hypothetical protein